MAPRGQSAGRNPAQAWAQLALAPHWHCVPHWQCGPQAQAVCTAACWQPQVQPVPGQVVQLQETC
jgi:hypothetical protein